MHLHLGPELSMFRVESVVDSLDAVVVRALGRPYSNRLLADEGSFRLWTRLLQVGPKCPNVLGSHWLIVLKNLHITASQERLGPLSSDRLD